MYPTSSVMATFWRLTGLEEWPSRLSVVYTASIYAAYACLCAWSAVYRLAEYRRMSATMDQSQLQPTGGKLMQIWWIRMLDAALLSVVVTAVYWCTTAYRHEQGRVREEHAAVTRRLFGGTCTDIAVTGRVQELRRRFCPPKPHVTDACCWALYGLLAAILLMETYRYAGSAPWTYLIMYVWGHFTLLTGNFQFVVTVIGLRRCYRELNSRMQTGVTLLDTDSGTAGTNAGSSSTKVSSKVVVPARPDRRDATVLFTVLDKVNLLSMLKHWSDLHWSITLIVSRVNNLFKFRLLVFFVSGLLHLMFTPYLLSLTILYEDIDILPHMIERILWFIIHILRVVLMIYPCALLGEEAAKTQILLGSHLNTKIDYFDIKKVETYVQQLNANKPEFSIYGMFVIDKRLVVKLTGAVATYLVIILQLQGQS